MYVRQYIRVKLTTNYAIACSEWLSINYYSPCNHDWQTNLTKEWYLSFTSLQLSSIRKQIWENGNIKRRSKEINSTKKNNLEDDVYRHKN